jgi:hypothetical protein
VHPEPLHPVKVEVPSGVAVNVTEIPSRYVSVQSLPQLIPDGSLVTVPPPVPDFVTVRTRPGVKSAATDLAASIVITQVPVPEQPEPLQPVKTDPESASAVRVTDSPWSNGAVQVRPQLIPEGLLVTVPLPLPPLVTLKVHCFTKFAVTDSTELTFTVHWLPASESHPLHEPTRESDAGVAVRITVVPSSYVCVQSEGQLIPAGELVTEPLPLPAGVTDRSHSFTNVAVTDSTELTFTVHWLLETESQPLHDPNREPNAAVAVRVTVVPWS